MSYYTEGEIIPDTRRQLGAILPLIDSISDVTHLYTDLGCDPTVNIVPVEQPRLYVAPSDDCSIMVLDAPPVDLWDVDEIVDLSENPLPDDLWDVNQVVDINMGNEVWTKGIPVVPSDIPKEDVIQKQLERIPNAVSFWGLISSSKEHHEKLFAALAHLKVPTDITPKAMIALILPLLSRHFVTFTERDLPVEGTAHYHPLHITVKCKGLWVPTVLIDNGSTINVCPLKVAYRLRIAKKDFVPSNLAVKAYDSTRRVVERTIVLKLDAEGFDMDVEFHVVDIPVTFNLLLGRPWLHRPDIMAVPSTLHQKVMLGLLTGTLTTCGDSGICPLKDDETPISGIMHGEEDSDYGGFSFDTSGSVLSIAVDNDFIISSDAFEIMRRMSFMPGLGLWINHYFVREGGSIAYLGQPEPFWDLETSTWLPGFEIFAVDTWSDSEEEMAKEELAKEEFKKQLAQIQEKADWLKIFEQGDLEMLFSQVGLFGKTEEAEVLMLGPYSPDILEDLTSLIVEAKGSINNCIFTPCLTCIDDISESDIESVESKSSSESEFVPLGPPRRSFYFKFESSVLGNPFGFYEMHDPISDYFVDLYINCVDPDDEGTDFDRDIPAKLRSLIERHAQPLKEEVISVNLKDEGDPCMIQIGLTLSPDDHAALIDLLKEYFEVFAWSHKDMPGIDPEIVQHRIPLAPGPYTY
ncbi:hypothetical protein RHMOL_Rhmol04G0210600 [Rhododendron molle]|uniref:Uncharacterized protein n=1 Tax=Rhododendron molle TaxID=49168 RepID=A0ACC0P2W6_RHOML|nr:hypothetical protein RHMOL_Rhmol04G0210600 [Rhododendron molle]